MSDRGRYRAVSATGWTAKKQKLMRLTEMIYLREAFLCYCPRIGKLTNMMMIPKESFSPESGGRVKARMAMEAMRMQGIIRLKKLRIYIYRNIEGNAI